jgi:putative transposase
VRTTKPDLAAARHPDLVQRKFTASGPNQLWVTDLTFVPTWAGVAYVCFIVDAYSRMIVGWRVASHMRTTMVLDALEMARWSRGNMLSGLISHSDAGSQFTSSRYGERLAESEPSRRSARSATVSTTLWPRPSTANYKSELVYGPARSGPWKTVGDVEVATLGWVHWHNTGRLHGYLGDIPPAEFEAAFYDNRTVACYAGNFADYPHQRRARSRDILGRHTRGVDVALQRPSLRMGGINVREK